ncbi:hypothetical protein SEUCBS140593_004041 [Sporothrix eucalyptigena]|uniref:N-acetyl-D-glucosamine kinase n=1 Tax=Sporothrix eucalyptigena TaxID=1812306 RepID=A0ABP0BJS3_9PEZI
MASTVPDTPDTPDTPAPPSYVLCVDGGGSKCTAVLISSEGTILTGHAGPCNPSTIGIDATIAVITSAILSALATTDNTTSQTIASLTIASAWVGIAGYDRPALAPAINEAVSNLLSLSLGPRLRITADIDLLSVNAVKQPETRSAIVLVAGTGSVAMSYTKMDGDAVMYRSGRVGGWGPLLGDDGSGFSIGKAALRVALRTSDAVTADPASNIDVPPLSQAVFDMYKEERKATGNDFLPRDLLSCILTSSSSSSPTKTIAHAARLVLSLSKMDEQSQKILKEGAASLADLVVELLRIQKLDPGHTALVMAGGLLCHGIYNTMVGDELARRDVKFKWSTQVESPALEGAKFLAEK